MECNRMGKPRSPDVPVGLSGIRRPEAEVLQGAELSLRAHAYLGDRQVHKCAKWVQTRNWHWRHLAVKGRRHMYCRYRNASTRFSCYRDHKTRAPPLPPREVGSRGRGYRDSNTWVL